MRITPCLAGGTLLLASTALLAAPPQATAATTSPYGGSASGTVTHVSAASLPATELARVSLAQSAAGAGVGQALRTQDALGSRLLTAPTAGRTAYGHGAGLGVGLLQAGGAPPQVALSTAEATSPAATTATPTTALPVALAPLASAHVLPSTARALSTSTGSACAPGGGPVSQGSAQLADASLLALGGGRSVLDVGGTARSTSTVTVSGGAVVSRTTQALAPITLFKGVPGAAIGIDALRDLELTTTATGTAGTATTSYGFAGVDHDDDVLPVLAVTVNGTRTALTSKQVLGSGGIQLSLGVADVLLAAPATATAAANGTTASASADLVRVTVPGTLRTGSTTPVDGPLGPVLNPVLAPVVTALSPVLTGIRSALDQAGLGIADVRYGHLEGASRAPVGGVVCSGAAAPAGGALGESRVDVSSQGPAAGTTFDVTIRVPNRGDLPLREVTVVDRYSGGPPGLEVVSTGPAATGRDDGRLTFGIGTLAPGAYEDVTITFRVPPGADPGTVYRNDVTITGVVDAPAGGTVTEDVSAPRVTVVAPPTGSGCDLSSSLVQATNTRVLPGDQFAYLVHVANTGGAQCSGTTVTQQLDDGVAFVSCSDGCAHSGRTVTWDLAPIGAGGSQTVSAVVRTTATSGSLPTSAVIDPDSGATTITRTAGPAVGTTSTVRDPQAAGCPGTGCPAAGDGTGSGDGSGAGSGDGSGAGDGSGSGSGDGSEDGSTGGNGDGTDAEQAAPDGLARTGATVLMPAGLALALIAGGLVLLVRTRRTA